MCDSDAANDNTTCVQDCAGEWGGSTPDTDDDGICDAAEIVGCQDIAADNYNAEATDAGDCIYTPVAPGLLTPTVGQPFTLTAGQDLDATSVRSEEHTSELQSRRNLVCRLLHEKKKKIKSKNKKVKKKNQNTD